ncbi:TraB/GumN family protein [Niabella sp.]|uniref:TraB/GumN family protein n=1 Tax=Niabella sp. TaxID=1962976 RepID=UPI00260EB383|nr:TraB/GumN family protein [Niabella sp.]
MKKATLLAVAVILCVSAMAQFKTKRNISPVTSLLWEISGNGLAKPSYVLGTIHALCKKDFQLKPKVLNALNAVTGLYLEVDFTDPTERVAMGRLMQGEKTISGQLSPQQTEAMKSALKLYNLTLEQADHFTIAGLYSLFALKAIDCPQEAMKMMELELISLALKDKKTVRGLEKISEQTHYIEQIYNWDDCIDLLKKGDQYKTASVAMVTAYKNEDLVALDRTLKNPAFMSERAEALLLTKRNHNWATQMPGIMRTEPVLFAVGAGHLWGNAGVLAQLRAQGYDVKPVLD